MSVWARLNNPWATVIAGALIAAGIIVGLYISEPDKARLLVDACSVASTFLLAVVTYLLWRSQRRIEWFAGAMERHSDQQRQFAAKNAGVKMIWWNPTKSEGRSKFPFNGEHGKEVKLDEIYIGIPLEYRSTQPSALRRWFFGDQ